MKGIATETIAKMLLVLIVVAIMVFLIIRYVLKSGLSERECAARMTAWCGQCQIANKGSDTWDSEGVEMGEGLGECANNYWHIGSETTNCKGFEGNCKAFLPSV